MDAVWEWEDTNIRWHTEKYEYGRRQIWEWEDTNIRWRTEKYGSTNLRMGRYKYKMTHRKYGSVGKDKYENEKLEV